MRPEDGGWVAVVEKGFDVDQPGVERFPRLTGCVAEDGQHAGVVSGVVVSGSPGCDVADGGCPGLGADRVGGLVADEGGEPLGLVGDEGVRCLFGDASDGLLDVAGFAWVDAVVGEVVGPGGQCGVGGLGELSEAYRRGVGQRAWGRVLVEDLDFLPGE